MTGDRYGLLITVSVVGCVGDVGGDFSQTGYFQCRMPLTYYTLWGYLLCDQSTRGIAAYTTCSLHPKLWLGARQWQYWPCFSDASWQKSCV